MDLNQISHLIGDCVITSLIPISIISIVFAFRFKSTSHYIPLFLAISLLFEIAGIILGELYGYNLFLFPLFSLFDYFIWSRFFTLKQSKQRKQLIWIDIPLVIYVVLELYCLWTGEEFLPVPSYSLTSLFVIIVMIYNYIKVYKIETGIHWSIYSFVFVYALFNCFFGLFFEFIVYWKDDIKFYIWISHSVLLFVFYLFLSYYQWKIGKNPQDFLFG